MKITLILAICLISNSFCTNLYSLSRLKYSNNSSVMEADLNYKSKDFDIDQYDIKPIQNKTSVQLIKDLKLSISLLCDSVIRVTVRDLKNKRWEMPLDNDDFSQKASDCVNYITLQEFGLSFEKDPFSFSLTYDNITYYTWKGGDFLYSDTLISFEALLTTDLIFGFGERNSKFKLENGKYTIWPNDTGVTYPDEKDGGYNLMGHQPIGLHMVKSDLFVGLIFLNSNAQDVVINTKGEATSLKHITVGGIIDYYIVIGKSADAVLAKIHEVIGRPIIPPFWSLGWHHSRWGYWDTNALLTTYRKYREFNIPIDTFWSDIDILHKKRNFQLSSRFRDVKTFIDLLHKDNSKYIPIIDYGIPNDIRDPYYKYGIELGDAFILSNYTEDELVSKSWPGNSIILDLFSENGIKVLNRGLKDFDSLLNFDGIWLDMNEPGIIDVLYNGKGETCSSYPVEKNKYKFIPYIPGYRIDHSDLETKAVSLNGYSITDKIFRTMHNVRSLLVREQVKIVNEYLYKTGRRPFIISRANIVGHGKHSFHWLGDNNSTFRDMKDSVSGVFNYNIFGVPMTGADICGFHGDTTDELCARWHVLGAFYPFSRNHNVIYQKLQEPWEFKTHTLKASILAIRTKYSLIRYMYSQLYLISLGEKGSLFKPAFFEFPEDENLLKNIEDTIMVGSSFYFVPNFSASTKYFSAYFPNSNWNSFPSGNSFMNYDPNSSKGKSVSLSGNFDIIHLFLKGGSIIPYQNVILPYVIKTTVDLRSRPTEIVISPNENFFAEGDLIFDNDAQDSLETKNYLHVKIDYALNTIYFTQLTNLITDYNYEDIYISKVTIYNGRSVQKQYKKDITECEIFDEKEELKIVKVKYDLSKDYLVIDFEGLKISFKTIKTIILN